MVRTSIAILTALSLTAIPAAAEDKLTKPRGPRQA